MSDESDWERGYRDGIVSAANMVDDYASGLSVDDARYLRSCAEVLRAAVEEKSK